MFLEFDFVRGPFYKKYIRLRWIKKLHKTKSDRRLILGAVPVIKNVKILKILSATRPAQPSSPVFFSRGAQTQNSAPNIMFSLLTQFRKGATQPPCTKSPGGERFGRNLLFWGQGHLLKNYLQGGLWALKILRRSVQGFKSDGTFSK